MLCKFDSITFKADINETIVFPLPTSPCKSLNILLLDERSLSIFSKAFF